MEENYNQILSMIEEMDNYSQSSLSRMCWLEMPKMK